MSMFKAGLAISFVIIGGLAALLGAAVTLGALRTGVISLSYGSGAGAVADTVTQAGDPDRFWRLAISFGGLPLILGSIAAAWGWRTLKLGR